MSKSLEQLTQRLGYRFSDPTLLQDALTHRSAGKANYERLEFLGDAMLSFVVADMLFEARPEATEGELSRLRASLVNRDTLAEIAGELDLAEYLVFGGGVLKSGGYRRASILADATEAVLGAVYREGGFDVAAGIVRQLFRGRVEMLPEAAALKDAKTQLQEFLQSRQLPRPVYRIVDVSGEGHKQSFRVECQVEGLEVAPQATGTSRRKAEQAAAHAALEELRRHA